MMTDPKKTNEESEVQFLPDEVPQCPERSEEIPLEDTQCGWGSCRPSWLQYCANIKMYTFILAMVNTVGSMNFSYYSAVITQIEKCFGLSSAMTGFLKNVDHIGFVMVALIVTHFCRYTHIPKLFSIGTVIAAIAVCLFGLPHFIYGSDSPYVTRMLGNDTQGLNITLRDIEMCDGVNELDESGCSKRSYLSPLNVGALAIFIISELVQGVAMSPKYTLSITYMDDNAKKESPMYYGFFMGSRAFSPVLGFMLGAWCTSLYVDLSVTDLDPKDPRFVGAWWLGFIICGVCTSVCVLPLSLFPPVIPGQESTAYIKSRCRSTKENLKDLPKAIWRLVTNPILLCNMAGGCFNLLLMGYATFFPKYLEVHFGMTAAKASMLAGVISMCSLSAGPIVSGILVSRMKVTPTRALLLLVILQIVSVMGFILAMLMGCPQGDWAGTVDVESVDLATGCNSNCSCDPFLFAPVCGSDNVNYFSSCYAGCTGLVGNATHKVLTGCSCIPDGMAHVGQCDRGCNMMYPFIAIVIITKFVTSMSTVPAMAINMGAVAKKDKALSLAMYGVVIVLISFPAPMLYGYIIDKTCIIEQTSCTRTGACLLYDSDKFRYMLHGVTGCFQFAAFAVYVLGFLWSRNKDKKEAKKTEGEAREEGKEMLPIQSLSE